ncbi:EAL domain-containing protein [Pseudoalteromonas fenneropenaei]|uniref:EAL domain-containing protein n=1 Tax=Pseudoalteromonas fenneropenaei TaxID=1737459 RepID=A0ABV7CEY3_9GAMM
MRLSPNEGLSQSYVRDLVIDEDGYLWLSTEGGLNRYDGYQVLKVDGPDGELAEANIDRIYLDSQGKIWITSTIAGLFSFDPKTDQYRQYMTAPVTEEEFRTKPVYQMTMLDEQHMLLGRSQDVLVLNIASGEITTLITLPSDGEPATVRQLQVFGDYIFIATAEMGAFVYQQSSRKFRPINHLDNIEHPYQNNTKSFYFKDAQTLLLGAVQGLYEIDISNLAELMDDDKRPFAHKTLFPELNIWHMLAEPNGLVMGTDKGLMHYNWVTGELNADTRLSKSQYTLVDPSIVNLVRDHNGGLWLASRTDGAFYLPKPQGKFTNVNNQTLSAGEFSHPNTWDITEANGYLWVATQDGLTRYDPQTNTAKVLYKGYLGETYFPEFVIYKLMPYQGKIWLSGMRGLFIFDPVSETLRRPTSQDATHNEILQDRVSGVELLPNGLLYFVHAEKGMYVYDINRQVLTDISGDFNNADPFLAHGFFKPLATHPEQPLFFTSGTLSRYDPKANKLIKIYSVPGASEHLGIAVNSYIIDRNNILWLSLTNFGLLGLTADGYEHVYTIDLEKNNLGTLMYSMNMDDEGMIWMSSHKGIWRLDPDNLHFQQFSIQDGLVANEFNGEASTRLADGRLVYGSVQGFTSFLPSDNNPKIPLVKQVNITSVQLMSRDIRQQGLKKFRHITLNHDDIGLEVVFSAMAFNYQDRIVYEYQISGGQKTYSRNNQRVLFPKLNPGLYELKVWAKDPLTGQYTPPAKLDIEVLYPKWRSPLAIASYIAVLFLLVSIWLVRRNRIQQLLLKAHRETQHSEARLKLALEGSNSGVWDWQAQNSLIYQPRFRSELGYPHENVTLDEYLAKIHPKDKALFRLEWLEFVSTQKGYFNCTYRLRDSEGHWRWYKDFGKVMEWQGHSPLTVAGTYTNLTRERVFEERARVFGAAFEQTRDWVFILDKRLRVRACNSALQQAFGMTEVPLSSTSLTLGLSRQTRMQYIKAISQLQQGELFSAEEALTLKNGETRQALIKVSAVASDNTDLVSYVVVMTDITEQKRAEQELYQLANYDVLTGLPNRTLFVDRIQHAIEQGARTHLPIAVLSLNFKRLQHIAQLYGPSVYQNVLACIVALLQEELQEHDSLAVSSQKEFYVLMEQVLDDNRVLRFCRRVIARFNQGCHVSGHEINLVLGIGVAVYPEDSDNAIQLLQMSGLALNHAMQRNHSNYQFFKEEMNQRVMRAAEIEKALYSAVNQGAFSNHYQPIINANSNQIDGFEVLLRWPQDCQFSAEELAKTAEHTGLITRISLQTLERALIELKSWHVSHPHLYISVNLSAHDFQVPDLVASIAQLLKQLQVQGEAVAFEITESVLLADTSHAIAVMQQLQALGCRLLMDDFGTGYASLTYLQTFPIDVLKIDRSFVMQLDSSSRHHREIVRSIVMLAHNLGKRCVAEGVENATQLAYLQSLGCDYFQGFLFSPAIAGDDVAALLARDWQHTLHPV